jgi:hypothetical protein
MYVYGFLERCLGNFLCAAQPFEKFISLRTLLRPQRRKGNFCAHKERQYIALYVFASKQCKSLARSPGAWFCVMAIGSADLHAITLCVVKRNCASPQQPRETLLLYVSILLLLREWVCGGNFPALEMRSCT